MKIRTPTNKDKFCADELIITAPKCLTCKHYDGNLRCAAFPEGVPTVILTGEVDHDTPIVGDHGLQYERIE
jgi:hypothetical protein